jgi:hypothetical protein
MISAVDYAVKSTARKCPRLMAYFAASGISKKGGLEYD